MIVLGQWAAWCLLVSLLLWLGTGLATSRHKSIRSWPAFWSALLGLSVIIPTLTLLLNRFPDVNPVQHLPLPDLTILMAAVTPTAVEPITESQGLMADQVWTLVGSIWLAGVVLGMIGLLIGRWRVAMIIRQSTGRNLAGTCIRVSRHAPTAFACSSVWRRRSWIVLPQAYLDQLTHQDLVAVIRHEQAHLDRHDDRWGLCWRLLRCAGWCSPAVRRFFQGWVLSTELHCDQRVVAQQSESTRRAYARSIVQAHGIAANRVLSYPAASFSPHQPWSESMRITHILSGERLQIKNRGAHLRLLAMTGFSALTASMTLSAQADSQAGTPLAATTSPFSEWVPGKVSSEYGMRPFGSTNKALKKFHKGIDIAAPEGSVIRMPDDGVVVVATDLYQNQPAYGKVVIIETANQTRTLLAHLSEYSVSEGQTVPRGTPIATVGSTGQVTGPHAHIETWVGEARVNPREVW